jgi:hypothetical protein
VNRKALPSEVLFYSFTFHKQTLKELARLYHVRISEVQKVIDEYVLPTVIHIQGEVYIQVSETVELFSSEPEVSMVRRVFQHAIILTCFALLIAVAAYLGWMVYLETYLEQ